MGVSKDQMNALPYIIAVDFDGTLVGDKFPEIGAPNQRLFNQIKSWKEQGHRIVLWTCRDGIQLAEAVIFCRQNGVEFDAVNQNIPEVIALFNNDTRKVYANLYIDDKAVLPSLGEPYAS